MMKPLHSVLLAIVGVFAICVDLSACSVCFTSTEDTRDAFYYTTILLTCTPLALVGGTVFVLNRRLKAANDGSES